MKKLRIAIVGCRKMGCRHLKVLRENFADQVEIAGILNSTAERTRQKAEELGVPAFSSLEEITPDTVDGIIIATPATTHCKIGCTLLARGIPCLIEKPLGTNEIECRNLIAAAETGKTTLFTGHTENYNPAVIKLKQILNSPVKKIEAIRVSQNASPKNVSVIQELMIHDLAIVNSFITTPLIEAKVSKKEIYRWDENARVIMKFSDGASVDVEGIIHPDAPAARLMKITDKDENCYQIRFLERSLSCNGKEICRGGDSLANELGNFIGILQGEQPVAISATEALKNVLLCNELEKHIAENPH